MAVLRVATQDDGPSRPTTPRHHTVSPPPDSSSATSLLVPEPINVDDTSDDGQSVATVCCPTTPLIRNPSSSSIITSTVAPSSSFTTTTSVITTTSRSVGSSVGSGSGSSSVRRKPLVGRCVICGASESAEWPVIGLADWHETHVRWGQSIGILPHPFDRRSADNFVNLCTLHGTEVERGLLTLVPEFSPQHESVLDWLIRFEEWSWANRKICVRDGTGDPGRESPAALVREFDVQVLNTGSQLKSVTYIPKIGFSDVVALPIHYSLTRSGPGSGEPRRPQLTLTRTLLGAILVKAFQIVGGPYRSDAWTLHNAEIKLIELRHLFNRTYSMLQNEVEWDQLHANTTTHPHDQRFGEEEDEAGIHHDDALAHHPLTPAWAMVASARHHSSGDVGFTERYPMHGDDLMPVKPRGFRSFHPQWQRHRWT